MKTAVVTGASSGIGYEFSRVLAAHQYQLVLIARNLERLNQVKQELEAEYHVNVVLIPADLSVPNIAQNIFQELQRREIVVDVIINNAAFGYCGDYVDQAWENEAQMLQVNIVALSQLTKLLLPEMITRGQGRICNVASTAAFSAGPLMAVYYASKAYVLSYSEALAKELDGAGVTVTCLCPGPTATNFQANARMENTRVNRMSQMVTAQQVAEYGYQALMKNKAIAIYGFKNKLLQFSTRLLPRKMITHIIHQLQRQRL